MTFALLLAAALAQSTGTAERTCWTDRPAGVQRVQAERGYVIELAFEKAGAPEAGCSIVVKDAEGKVVYRNEGFNTRIHADSGRDVTNDGHGDLVLGTDTGGGNRCCWSYAVVSLVPSPHVVTALSEPQFTRDDRGRTVIWTTTAFYGFDGSGMAGSPAIRKAHQFRSGTLTEITREYCDAMLAGRAGRPADYSDEVGRLTPDRKLASRTAGTRVTDEIHETRSAAIVWALQAMTCGRRADAVQLVREVWPAAETARLEAAMQAALETIR
jgi:hypothetical protein